MKNIFNKTAVLLLALGALSTSCTDMLKLQSYTSVTTDYVFNTPDGIYRAGTALYVMEKEMLDSSNDLPPVMRDGGTDITWSRTGGHVFSRITSLTSNSEPYKTVWPKMYAIIGKANEIIASAEAMGLDNPKTLQGWAEAKTFRARSYFYLVQRFPKFLLVTEPTTTENCFRTDYEVANTDDVWALINSDLQDVIDANGLDWVPYEGQSGRLTLGVVKHVKAQVAMWEKDWDEVIALTEEIFARPEYSMMPSAFACFDAADLNFSENLFVYQFSENIGGALSINSSGIATGHKMGKNVNNLIARQETVANSDLNWQLSMGGYGWARIFPNVSLFNLYGDTDLRAKEGSGQCLFRFTQYYPESHPTKAGKEVTCPGDLTSAEYTEYAAAVCLKDIDSYTRTDKPMNSTAFKDIVVYRLAETYLMAAEAYLMKGDNANAVRCYNETYERANPKNPFTGTLTINDIVDEHARELCMEGLRWCFLKRLGILGERFNKYSGITMAEEPRLSVTTYGEMVRGNFVEGKHEYWPIPQGQLELLESSGITQVEGWE